MKIILTPNRGGEFTPGDLCQQLARWVPTGSTAGTVHARVTLGGKLRELTIDVPHPAEPDSSQVTTT